MRDVKPYEPGSEPGKPGTVEADDRSAVAGDPDEAKERWPDSDESARPGPHALATWLERPAPAPARAPEVVGPLSVPITIARYVFVLRDVLPLWVRGLLLGIAVTAPRAWRLLPRLTSEVSHAARRKPQARA
jgi:hypothetical protein